MFQEAIQNVRAVFEAAVTNIGEERACIVRRFRSALNLIVVFSNPINLNFPNHDDFVKIVKSCVPRGHFREGPLFCHYPGVHFREGSLFCHYLSAPWRCIPYSSHYPGVHLGEGYQLWDDFIEFERRVSCLMTTWPNKPPYGLTSSKFNNSIYNANSPNNPFTTTKLMIFIAQPIPLRPRYYHYNPNSLSIIAIATLIALTLNGHYNLNSPNITQIFTVGIYCQVLSFLEVVEITDEPSKHVE